MPIDVSPLTVDLLGGAATKKEKWVKDNQGQMIITAGQIVWTNECEKALQDPDAAKRELRALKKKWVSYLNKLTAITRSKLNKIERNKVRCFLLLVRVVYLCAVVTGAVVGLMACCGCMQVLLYAGCRQDGRACCRSFTHSALERTLPAMGL
jgi:hypothetical protein